jgi:hypothetical protein
MNWVISQDRRETRRLKQKQFTLGSTHVCQWTPKQAPESVVGTWLGFYQPSIAFKPQRGSKLFSAALCVASAVKNAIVLEPLGQGIVWLCVIKEGVPVVGFDELLSSDEVDARVELCQSLFKHSPSSHESEDKNASSPAFEVIPALELLAGMSSSKPTPRAERQCEWAARLRPLRPAHAQSLRWIWMTCKALLIVLSLLGLFLLSDIGVELGEVLQARMGLDLVKNAFKVGTPIHELQQWINREWFPERIRLQTLRLNRLTQERAQFQAQRNEELNRLSLEEKKREQERKTNAFWAQQHELKAGVAPLDLWSEFNRVRQSMPISHWGQQVKSMHCEVDRCDVLWTVPESNRDHHWDSVVKNNSNLSSTAAASNPLKRVTLNLKVQSLDFENGLDEDDLWWSMKEAFSNLPIDWGGSSGRGQSIWLKDLEEESTAGFQMQARPVKSLQAKCLLAKTGEWSLTLTGETMLVRAEAFVRHLSVWPMELLEINFVRSETLMLKGKWFYFPNQMCSA